MLYNQLRLYIPTSNVLIPSFDVKTKKNISICIFGENTNLQETINKFGFGRNFINKVFVPNIRIPFSIMMDQDYKNFLISNKFKPIRGLFKDINEIKNSNYYVDLNYGMDKILERFKIISFNTSRALYLENMFINELENINKNNFQVVILYVIDHTKPFNDKLMTRKGFSLFRIISNNFNTIENLPFDKIILVNIENSGINFNLIFDKNQKNNLSRLKTILTNFKEDNKENSESIVEGTNQEYINQLNKLKQERIDLDNNANNWNTAYNTAKGVRNVGIGAGVAAGGLALAAPTIATMGVGEAAASALPAIGKLSSKLIGKNAAKVAGKNIAKRGLNRMAAETASKDVLKSGIGDAIVNNSIKNPSKMKGLAKGAGQVGLTGLGFLAFPFANDLYSKMTMSPEEKKAADDAAKLEREQINSAKEEQDNSNWIDKQTNTYITTPLAMAKKNLINNWKTYALGAAGIGTGVLLAKYIKNIIDKHNYEKNGCENITDPSKKEECQLTIDKNTLNILNSRLKKCKDDNCKQLIQNQIDQIYNKISQ